MYARSRVWIEVGTGAGRIAFAIDGATRAGVPVVASVPGFVDRAVRLQPVELSVVLRRGRWGSTVLGGFSRTAEIRSNHAWSVEVHAS